MKAEISQPNVSLSLNGASARTKMGAPLLDINRANSMLREEILAAVAEVCDSGRFLHGPPVAEFENAMANLCQTSHAVGCASGSDALLLALMALEIGPGDEVITPSFTFFATASAVWRLGAKPVFADIDGATFNLNPAAVEAAITPATRAIIPVHLFGQCAEMDAILKIARRHNLAVIEDAAQAIGAAYRGRMAGSMGDIGCFSFYPTKNLGAFGDAGMVVTSNAELAEKIRLLAAHGMHPRYYHSMVGVNSRLDSIQAAVLCVKLQYLSEWTAARQQNAQRYHSLFADGDLDTVIRLPHAESHQLHVWNQYTVQIPELVEGRRDAWRRKLSEANIGSEIYYPVPLHLQECFHPLGYAPGSLPNTEQAAREVLSLPIFPELTLHEQQAVAQRFAAIVAEESSLTAKRAA